MLTKCLLLFVYLTSRFGVPDDVRMRTKKLSSLDNCKQNFFFFSFFTVIHFAVVPMTHGRYSVLRESRKIIVFPIVQITWLWQVIDSYSSLIWTVNWSINIIYNIWKHWGDDRAYSLVHIWNESDFFRILLVFSCSKYCFWYFVYYSVLLQSSKVYWCRYCA